MPSGRHFQFSATRVIFDATGLPSGVYIYRLQAGDYVETKRMVVVKWGGTYTTYTDFDTEIVGIVQTRSDSGPE